MRKVGRGYPQKVYLVPVPRTSETKEIVLIRESICFYLAAMLLCVCIEYKMECG